MVHVGPQRHGGVGGGGSNPITGLERLSVFQEVEASRFQHSWHRKVVRLSALHTGRLYPSGNIHGIHFWYGWVDPSAIVWLEELCQ